MLRIWPKYFRKCRGTQRGSPLQDAFLKTPRQSRWFPGIWMYFRISKRKSSTWSDPFTIPPKSIMLFSMVKSVGSLRKRFKRSMVLGTKVRKNKFPHRKIHIKLKRIKNQQKVLRAFPVIKPINFGKNNVYGLKKQRGKKQNQTERVLKIRKR